MNEVLISKLIKDSLDGQLTEEEVIKLDPNNETERLFAELFNSIIIERKYIYDLSSGNIRKCNHGLNNRFLDPLKDLHSTLNHLLFATRQFADGKYDMKIEFLGDFSKSFDLFIEQISKRERLQIEKNHALNDQLEIQVKYYELVNEIFNNISKIKHDFRNHCFVINELLNSERLDEAKNYLGLIASKILVENKNVIFTKNPIFDALLNEKIQVAKDLNINAETNLVVKPNINVTSMDWCVLIGNALDNAIEACSKVEKENRELMVKATSKGNFLSLAIKNSSLPVFANETGSFETSKSDKINHGIGMKNMQEIVEKYNGTMEASYADGFFTVKILLCDV